MRVAPFLLLALCGAAQAQDSAERDLDRLLCLGTRPGFSVIVENGDTVAFDYLGDGRYTLDPPLERFDGFRTHELVTARERWQMFFETRNCSVLNINLPITLEIAVPTSAGDRPLTGCCKWQFDEASGS